ncbi:unnamed protein product [Phytophthora lilii]|uniref:Unnamed protein product n=1 Tax=Phytophthora lilii TaxID=2077276 RepID=A0A9W6WXS9_9STRA|nr:unnamed protein product [Phytophthora lilii]
MPHSVVGTGLNRKPLAAFQEGGVVCISSIRQNSFLSSVQAFINSQIIGISSSQSLNVTHSAESSSNSFRALPFQESVGRNVAIHVPNSCAVGGSTKQNYSFDKVTSIDEAPAQKRRKLLPLRSAAYISFGQQLNLTLVCLCGKPTGYSRDILQHKLVQKQVEVHPTGILGSP